jgi:hypothetical protein
MTQENDAGAMSIVQSLLKRHTAPLVRGKALRPRWIGSGDKSLLAVFNDSRHETHKEQIRLPKLCAKAYNVYDRREVRIEDQSLQVEVQPESVCIFLVTAV